MRLPNLSSLSKVEPHNDLIYVPEQLAEPNLAIPGLAPTGPVKLDRSHPIGAAMVDYWLFDGRYGNYVPTLGDDRDADIDVALTVGEYDTHPGYIGGTGPPIVPVHANRCLVQKSFVSPAGTMHLRGYGMFGDTPGPKVYGTEYTLISTGYTGATSELSAFCGPAAGSHLTGYFLTGWYHAASGSYVQFTNTPTVEPNGSYEFFVITKKGTTIKLYRNGELIDTKTSFSASAACQVGGIATANSDYANGRSGFNHAGIANRALSAEEVRSIYLDPYQFLESIG